MRRGGEEFPLPVRRGGESSQHDAKQGIMSVLVLFHIQYLRLLIYKLLECYVHDSLMPAYANGKYINL